MGEIFENFINASCIHYDILGEASIEKTPEPMKVIKELGHGKFIASFTKKAQPDYKGVLKSGRAVIFEAKHTDADRIEQSRLTDVQHENLEKYAKLGAYCFVLVSFKFQTFHSVPWQIWREMKAMFGRKYMTEEDLKPYKVPCQNGSIRFLHNMMKGDGQNGNSNIQSTLPL